MNLLETASAALLAETNRIKQLHSQFEEETRSKHAAFETTAKAKHSAELLALGKQQSTLSSLIHKAKESAKTPEQR